jgi:hypothetical protein
MYQSESSGGGRVRRLPTFGIEKQRRAFAADKRRRALIRKKLALIDLSTRTGLI